MTLEEIGRKHGTLKVQHGFMPIYERFFEPLREQKINLLEIGVHEGASLKTWLEYFTNAHILGVDKDLKFPASGEGHHIQTIQLDASKDYNWLIDSLGIHKYDIIIDDGSHIQSEVMASFQGLWDSVKPGGYYVVEDLFAAYDPVWNPDGHPFIDHIQSRLQNILIGGDSIQEIHWFGRNDINGILFLRKRYEDYRIQPLSEFQ